MSVARVKKKAGSSHVLYMHYLTADILKAFRTYYETATLEDVTDPNLVYNIKSRLDVTGYYDEHEVERVFNAEQKTNARQSELEAAIFMVVDRLLHRFKAAKESWVQAMQEREEAYSEMEALQLVKRDMGQFGHVYTCLSQIFDYGSDALAQWAIFYKRLIPGLVFERERDVVDLSQVAS